MRMAGQKKCWPGYTAMGKKKKGNKMVNNCVKNSKIKKKRQTVARQLFLNEYINCCGTRTIVNECPSFGYPT